MTLAGLYCECVWAMCMETHLNGVESSSGNRRQSRVGEHNVAFNSDVVWLNETRKPAQWPWPWLWAWSLWPFPSRSADVGEWIADNALSYHQDVATLVVSSPLRPVRRHRRSLLGARYAVCTVAWRLHWAVAVQHRPDVDVLAGVATFAARTHRRLGNDEKQKNQRATYTSLRKPVEIQLPVTATSGYERP